MLGGCGTAGDGSRAAVAVTPPVPHGPAATQCRHLVHDLPAEVDGQPARPVDPADALAAAWGDPPVLLRCGVARPAALHRDSQCFVVNHVGWFAAQGGKEIDASRPVTAPITFTTIGRSAYVEVTVPAADQPAADVLADLASAVRAHTTWPRPCR